jgi:hypothetical protein
VSTAKDCHSLCLTAQTITQYLETLTHRLPDVDPVGLVAGISRHALNRLSEAQSIYQAAPHSQKPATLVYNTVAAVRGELTGMHLVDGMLLECCAVIQQLKQAMQDATLAVDAQLFFQLQGLERLVDVLARVRTSCTTGLLQFAIAYEVSEFHLSGVMHVR